MGTPDHRAITLDTEWKKPPVNVSDAYSRSVVAPIRKLMSCSNQGEDTAAVSADTVPDVYYNGTEDRRGGKKGRGKERREKERRGKAIAEVGG